MNPTQMTTQPTPEPPENYELYPRELAEKFGAQPNMMWRYPHETAVWSVWYRENCDDTMEPLHISSYLFALPVGTCQRLTAPAISQPAKEGGEPCACTPQKPCQYHAERGMHVSPGPVATLPAAGEAGVLPLADQITCYLGNGGLFNPELMDHEKVRDLLMKCREALQSTPTLAPASGGTPETDAQVFEVERLIPSTSASADVRLARVSLECVSADFARSLETRLSSALVEARRAEGLYVDVVRTLHDNAAREDTLRAELSALRAERNGLRSEVEAVLATIPNRVQVREGGGPENLAASLAVNVGRLQEELGKFRADCESNGITKEARKDLPRLYRWQRESLESFRAKFNAGSNLQALDAIDQLRTALAEAQGQLRETRAALVAAEAHIQRAEGGV